jgi:hypothetical protein
MATYAKKRASRKGATRAKQKPEYGAPDLLLAVLFSAVVRLLGAVAFGLLGAGCLWAYHRAADRARWKPRHPFRGACPTRQWNRRPLLWRPGAV